MPRKLNKKKGTLYYLNHKNLITEIELLGHKLCFKDLFTGYLKVVFIGVVSAYLFKLPVYGYLIIIITAILFVPGIILSAYRSLYEQRKFSDATLYLEKMLHFFKKSRKIYTSLNEMLQVFPNGRVYDVIQKVIYFLQTSSEDGMQIKALQLIEEEFPNNRIKTLHTFMINVEEKGGNPTMGTELLLEDRELWTNRVVALQQEKHTIKMNIIIALILTLGLCLTILYIPLMISTIGDLDISGNVLVRWSSILLIIFLLFFYTRVNKHLSIHWLDSDLRMDEEKMEKRYTSFIHLDLKKEKIKSCLYAVVAFFITCILFIILHMKILLVFGLFLSVFLLNSYKLGYNIELKNIKKEITKAFPSWLLNVALLMQNENVQMSIAISYPQAPGILRPAIRQLLEELDKSPSSSEPFHNFLQELDLSEVRESMSTLYSISEASGGNAEDEFQQIIIRIIKYMDKAEQLKNRDKLAVMGAYISTPAAAGSLKLLIDMLVMLMTFISASNRLM